MKSLPNNLLPFSGEAYQIKSFFSGQESFNLLNKIKSTVKWRDDKITMFGKTYPQARKVAFYGDENIEYTYSRIKMSTRFWTDELKMLNDRLKLDYDLIFNTALVNYYRDGRDHMSWHRDDEPELGINPLIASISFGASRDFFFRHDEGEKVKLTLENGDLLLMLGETQHHWKHALPKRLKINEPRMNITFRRIFE